MPTNVIDFYKSVTKNPKPPPGGLNLRVFPTVQGRIASGPESARRHHWEYRRR
jgi:hypothetical protein